MLSDDFTFGKTIEKIMQKSPNLRFRDRDASVHYASNATTCGRQITYKALKTPQSNPPDFLGNMRMRLGSWVEDGLKQEFFTKSAPFNLIYLASQGDTGEHGTFYGTSWHGYRDADFMLKSGEEYTPFVCEIKTKIGYGGSMTVKESPWKKGFITPKPDTDWGYAQQLALYIRDAYHKTKDNSTFKKPIKDGVLLYYCHDTGLSAFVEFFAEYNPDNDTVHYYKVRCHQIPECNGDLDLTINLSEIASKWKQQDTYINKKELAPPDYTYRYDVSDERVTQATKTDLTAAIKNAMVIGDMKCKYCPYKNKCAEDLGISQEYTQQEIGQLKRILASKPVKKRSGK